MIPNLRAWDNVKQKMVKEDRILIWGESVLILDEGYDWNINDLSGSEIDDKYLMQSTGLKDKNGTEIFEGDVVRYTVVNQAMCGIYEVRQAKSGAWRMDNAIQGRELWLAKPHSLEVLGNIYENPDLMEGLGDG